jgi:hypothetical protein
MNSTLVESAALAALSYDDVCGILQLNFRSGAVYRYHEVPLPVYEALLAATSKGNYFNREIRGKYSHSRGLISVAGFGGEA